MSTSTTSAPGAASFGAEAERFLLEFLDIPAPSGFEGPAGAAWRAYAQGFAPDVQEDRLGNSIATVGSGRAPRVALVGHVDEIGLIITRIDDKGFLRCSNIGGWDVAVLVGQRVRVIGADGPVRGSIGRAAVHTLDKEQRAKLPKLTDLWIDIGAEDGDAARALVRVGDPVVLDVTPARLPGHRIMSRSLDDRLGSFAVLEALRACADSNGTGPRAEVIAVGSVGEEIGAVGAMTSAFALKPDVAIVVDVTSPGDTPGGTAIGELALGKGPIITRGATTNRRLVDLLVQTAADSGIEIQLRGMGLRTKTDADQLARAGAGVPAVLISIPGRYLHTPCEQADLRDVRATVDLIGAFVTRLAEQA